MCSCLLHTHAQLGLLAKSCMETTDKNHAVPGEVLGLLYYNLDDSQLAYLNTSSSWDVNLYAQLDAYRYHPTDAYWLLDAITPFAQVSTRTKL